MRKNLQSALLGTLGSVVAILVMAGCASQQAAQPKHREPAAPPPPQPAAKPVTGFGPAYSTFEKDGQRFTRSSMAFPTGLRESSGLLLEKVVPTEVTLGKPLTYEYHVQNLTDFEIRDVVVMDHVTENFKAGDADPAAADVSGGNARWSFESLAPKQTKVIRIRGTAQAEGTVVTCGWATYHPILCDPIKVTKADLQLVKSAPAEVLTCDPIPMKLVVKNTGSSTLTQVKVADALPDGLVSGGQRNLTFDAGTLAPGQSREFTFTANAARTGKYVNTAKATSAQGVEAQASSTTVARKPVLTISCEAPDSRFIGRPVDVCVKIGNTGDASSSSSVVELPVPAGATFQGATAGGRLADNKVVWDLGSVAPEASKEVCATFTTSAAGALRFAPTARGNCADPVSSSCQTKLSGIPAILLEVVDTDDPVEVGKTTTYIVTVTNQGSADATNVKLVCELEEAQQFVSGAGDSAVSASGQTVTLAAVPSIAPKAKASWRLVVKAGKVSNVRFKVSMTSDQLTRPVEETESTNQY